MSTCNWLDLQTLGSQPIMPKNLPHHCVARIPLPCNFMSCRHCGNGDNFAFLASCPSTLAIAIRPIFQASVILLNIV